MKWEYAQIILELEQGDDVAPFYGCHRKRGDIVALWMHLEQTMADACRWFHCTTHTYGAWLPGDPRGYRTWKHSTHIEGDYKNPPPPGTYDHILERSRNLLVQAPVVLAPEWRGVFGRAILEKLKEFDLMVLCIALSATHCHFLAKMPTGKFPKKWMGLAKMHANFAGKKQGWTGKLWAEDGKVNPINDRRHQLNTYAYILRHIEEGAWVWDFRKGERGAGVNTAPF